MVLRILMAHRLQVKENIQKEAMAPMRCFNFVLHACLRAFSSQSLIFLLIVVWVVKRLLNVCAETSVGSEVKFWFLRIFFSCIGKLLED